MHDPLCVQKLAPVPRNSFSKEPSVGRQKCENDPFSEFLYHFPRIQSINIDIFLKNLQ